MDRSSLKHRGIPGMLGPVAVSILLLLGGMPTGSVAGAQAVGPGPDDGLIAQLGHARVSYHSETGFVRFVGGSLANPVQAASGTSDPETAARRFVGAYGSLFGLVDPGTELRTMSVEHATELLSVVRFGQAYRGIPVLAGELAVQLDAAGNVLAATGEVSPKLTLDVTPALTAAQAADAAILATAKGHARHAADLAAAHPELWIYDPALLGGPGIRVPRLVWRTEVRAAGNDDLRDLVLIDASTGGIALAFSEIENALTRRICDRANVPGAAACAGSYARVEGNPPTGITDVDNAYDFLGDTYGFYASRFGRDSLDNAGLPLVATVRYCPASGCPYENAYWNGSQMVFGAGFSAADDVVAHELTHGVTTYSSNLLYYYQSGAINEAVSDIFGEFVDLTNGRGTDTPGVRWLLGEDLPGGAVRSMSNPPNYGQPDRMQSSFYFSGASDSGGVHYNSGVANKAAYLLTDGAAFNGRVVTGIGLEKTARVFYVAEVTLLTSGSDYQDLYDDLQQACTVSIGVAGITSTDCLQVAQAVAATEMNLQPVTGAATPEAPVCPSGETAHDIFFDGFEGPTTPQWVFTPAAGDDAWFNAIGWAKSGTHSLFVDDYPAMADSSAAFAASITLPSGAYLRFDHGYAFEPSYDGGVVEYSVNGGTTWLDAASLFTEGGYNGTISTGFGNPLAGRAAFTGLSYGYVSSRLNLGSFAGQNVRFRFRMGSDSSVGAFGWTVDNVRVYTCTTLVGATYVPLTPARLLDSRNGTGLSGAFASHVARTFAVTGHGGVPSNAIAVTGNLTVTAQTGLGFLYLGPVAMNDPTSSTLNFPLADDRANGVTVALSGTGTLSATYASPVGGATAQVLFDVTGYFVPTSAPATITAVGTLVTHTNEPSQATEAISVSPTAAGNVLVMAIETKFPSGPSFAASTVSGGGVTTWTRARAYPTSDGSYGEELWWGVVTSSGASTITVTYTSGSTAVDPGSATSLDVQQLRSSSGASTVWSIDGTPGVVDTGVSTTAPNYPSLTPTSTNEAYFGYLQVPGSVDAGTTPGVVYQVDARGNQCAYAQSVSSAITPVASSIASQTFFSIGLLLKAV